MATSSTRFEADDQTLLGDQDLAVVDLGDLAGRAFAVDARPEVGEQKPPGAGVAGRLGGGAGVEVQLLLLGLGQLGVVGALDDEEVGVAAEVGQQRRRAGVAGVGDDQLVGHEPHPGVGDVVRQVGDSSRHGPTVYAAAGRGCHANTRSIPRRRGPRPLGGEQLVAHLGRREGGDRRRRTRTEVARPEERVQVVHVVGVRMADDDRVDAVTGGRVEVGQQRRGGAVAEVEHDAEVPVLEHVAAAGVTDTRPGAAGAEDDEAAVHGQRDIRASMATATAAATRKSTRGSGTSTV